ncbi:MAG: hypothetical protein CSB28_01185 [Desulfobacterales bacterium]|nr:MAG: hypothetical protein CSB28_01185 [Desulfobacterales bacterium]
MNNVYLENGCIGGEPDEDTGKITVVGWNNTVPKDIQIGQGAVVYPELDSSHWPAVLQQGEVLK